MHNLLKGSWVVHAPSQTTFLREHLEEPRQRKLGETLASKWLDLQVVLTRRGKDGECGQSIRNSHDAGSEASA